MPRSRWRLPTAPVVVGGVVAALSVFAVGRIHTGVIGGSAAEAEFPVALGRHLEALKEAVPGNGGMAQEGPA